MRSTVTWLLFAVAVSACAPLPSAFRCRTNSQCVAGGAQGICEANGYCSLPDPSCLSGRRYHGAGSLDGICVGAEPLDGGASDGDGGSIGFAQMNENRICSNVSSLNATFQNLQTSGDLNVVFVAWGGAAQTPSVTDTAGNAYQVAGGPNAMTGAAQITFFASRIAGASSNTVTVNFGGSVFCPLVMILEYAGFSSLDANATAANMGSSASASSGTVMLAGGTPELLFAAGVPAGPAFVDGGGGFTVRIIDSLAGVLLEERITSAGGAYQATGTLSSPGSWMMQMVGFR